MHPTLGRDVVIKLPPPLSSADPELCSRLLAEGRILLELEHPHLARVYDFDFHEGRPFLAMEYLRGRTLDQYAQPRLPPRRAAAAAAAICRALAVAHQRGVLHLDIKPKNILVGEDNQLRLIDFGLARLENAWVQNPTESGRVSGTVQYMAPEQAAGETERLDARSDLFALGGVLFFLLTGQPPFAGATLVEAWERAKRCDWDPGLLAGAPLRLQAICRQAMAAAPEERYPRAEEMAADLEAAAGGMGRRAVAAAPVLAIVLGGLFWLGLERGRDSLEPLPRGEVPAIRALSPLSVMVWRRNRYRELADAAPLNDADEIRLRGEAPSGLHTALFWVNSSGQLNRLAVAPAHTGHTTVSYPPDEGQAAPLTGPPGTECALLLGRRSGPIDLGDVRALWEGPLSWPALPDASVLRLLPSGVRVEQTGRELGAPTGATIPRERCAAGSISSASASKGGSSISKPWLLLI